jgi:Tfp pilus assembly protein FimT
MIELIFVIVILGILAAVAVPKLNATRDDAYVSKTATAIASSATDIASSAVSRGMVENDLSLMSNILSGMINSGEAVQADLGVPEVDFKMGNVADCITMSISTTGNDRNLSITFGVAGGDRLCSSLQSLFNVADYPIPLKGSTVVQ